MYPTCVGMNRRRRAQAGRKIYVPHMRGDEPKSVILPAISVTCTPHAWG